MYQAKFHTIYVQKISKNVTVSWRSIVHNNHNVLHTIYYHIYLDDTYTFKYETVCFSKLFFCSEKTFSKNLHNYNAHMKKS